MTGEHDEPGTAPEPGSRPAAPGLGPPGWDDFVAARRRFEATLALQGLERAVAAAERGASAAGGDPRRWP